MSERLDQRGVDGLPAPRFMEANLDLTIRQVLPMMQTRIVEQTSYFGIQTLKNPLDFWVYQELICSTKPDVIVEIGNFHGGSLLALAHLCDVRKCGRVIGVDIDQSAISEMVRRHPRVHLIEGDAVAKRAAIGNSIAASDRVLVIEDSSHTYENTLAVLYAYADLVSQGSYLIVEDGICHNGLDLGPRPGPYEAVTEFLRENDEFVLDRERESFFITWNPCGYLRRVH